MFTCIPPINDWIELGSLVALALIIYQIWSSKKWRREDTQNTDKRHREDLDAIQQQADQIRVIAKNSTDELSVLSRMLSAINDQQISDSDRKKQEEELRKEQRKLDIRPFFTFKTGGTGMNGWELILQNEGKNTKLGSFKVSNASDNVENNVRVESPPNSGQGEELVRVLGKIKGVNVGTREQGETPFKLIISYEDGDGNPYQQSVDFERGAYSRPIISEPRDTFYGMRI